MLKNRFFLPYQLAWRFLFGRQQSAYVKFLVRLCFFGIFLGTAALCLTLMIMSGFESQIRYKARGMQSHAVISQKSGQAIDWLSAGKELQLVAAELQAVSATAATQIIIDHGNSFYTLTLKAVDAASFGTVSQLQNFITPHLEQTGLAAPQKSYRQVNLKRILSDNNVLLGHKVAKSLKVGLGDKINLLVPEINKTKVKLKEVPVVISGFIDVGFNEFDSGVLLCSLDFLWQVNGSKGLVDYVLINFANSSAAGAFSWQTLWAHLNQFVPWVEDWELSQTQKVAQQLPQFQVQAWQELYPALLSSMRLEKYVMFLVLLLISVVAIMNMIALLIVQIQAKRKDIVMFKVLGFGRHFIHSIFTIFGLMLTALASGAGLLFAAGVGYWFTHFMPLRLPDAYLVAFLPFDLHPANFIIVFVLTMLIGLLAVAIPARRATQLHVIEVLKDS